MSFLPEAAGGIYGKGLHKTFLIELLCVPVVSTDYLKCITLPTLFPISWFLKIPVMKQPFPFFFSSPSYLVTFIVDLWTLPGCLCEWHQVGLSYHLVAERELYGVGVASNPRASSLLHPLCRGKKAASRDRRGWVLSSSLKNKNKP